MLGHNEEISIRRVKSFFTHILSSSIQQNTQPALDGGVAGASYQVQAMHPVNLFIQIKRVPSELVGDVVKRLFFLGAQGSVISVFGDGLVVGMGGRGENAIQPGLFILVSRSCEGGPRQLLGVESIRRLLRRVLGDRQGAGYSFGSEILSG